MGKHLGMPCLQGEYVGLVSEPVSICGVDVSAPQQFRGQRRSTLDEMLESLGSCFTHNEVRRDSNVLSVQLFGIKCQNRGTSKIKMSFVMRVIAA